MTSSSDIFRFQIQEESQEMISSPEIISSEEARDASCLTPEPEDEPEEPAESVIVREIVGDAPQIKKVTHHVTI